MIDKVLAVLVARGLRRGLRGEPLWLAVGMGAWLVRRARREDDFFKMPLAIGDRIMLAVVERRRARRTPLGDYSDPLDFRRDNSPEGG